MIPLDGPLIVIKVNNPLVDEIVVYPEYGDSWKINGSKNGETVWSLDQLQDHFESVIRVLSKYVDEESVWIQPDIDQPISAWQALTLLIRRGEPDNRSLEGQ